MNKSELVDKVAEASGVTKTDVDSVISALFGVITDHVSHSDEKIQIPGYMAIERKDRAARTGRNPRTGETIQIDATKSVKITAGAKLKAAAKGQ